MIFDGLQTIRFQITPPQQELAPKSSPIDHIDSYGLHELHSLAAGNAIGDASTQENPSLAENEELNQLFTGLRAKFAEGDLKETAKYAYQHAIPALVNSFRALRDNELGKRNLRKPENAKAYSAASQDGQYNFEAIETNHGKLHSSKIDSDEGSLEMTKNLDNLDLIIRL